jgi:glycosyltransferase involved in cell wall biosynthesis
MKGLSIIVPAFNEAGNLEAAVREVISSARQVFDNFEVIIVDDGSTDQTWQVAHRLYYTTPCISRVAHHPTNQGLRAAYESGLAHAQYDHVTWVPGDGEIATESLVEIFRAVGTADIIAPYHGTPHKRPWFRRALTLISTTEINLLMGKRLHYWQGPVVLSTELARSLPRTVPGFLCMAEQLMTAMELGYSHVQVPLTHQERTYGVSKAVGWRRIWSAQMAVLRIWWRLKVRRDVQGLRKAPMASLAYST